MLLIGKLLTYWLSIIFWSHAPSTLVEKMQLRKFRKIFEFARSNSPFYKKFYYDHGVSNLQIRSWEDVEKVPIVDKYTMKQQVYEDLLTRPLNNGINIHSTSGSTGEPFNIAYSKFEDYTGHIRLIWLLMKNGYTPFKKMTLVTKNEPGQKFEVEEDISIVGKLQQKLHILERDVISIYEPPTKIIARLEETKPYVLWTTPSAAAVIAQELKREDKKLKIPLLLLISENVSEKDVCLFQEYLCNNYINHYGCMEAPTMSYGINNNAEQISIPNFVLFEQVNLRKVDKIPVGDLIITNFSNKTMPFVRYSLGDFAEVINQNGKHCKRIGKIFGRLNDTIEINGEQIFHMKLSQIFRGYMKCEQYKLVQRPDQSLELQLKISEDASAQDVSKEAEILWHDRFPNIPISITFKDQFHIDSKTGKYKVIERRFS